MSPATPDAVVLALSFSTLLVLIGSAALFALAILIPAPPPTRTDPMIFPFDQNTVLTFLASALSAIAGYVVRHYTQNHDASVPLASDPVVAAEAAKRAAAPVTFADMLRAAEAAIAAKVLAAATTPAK